MRLRRKEVLDIIKRSRQASKKLARILPDPQCCAREVEELLEQGALIEKASTHIKEKNSNRATEVEAITPVLINDRGDILAMMYRAGSLEKGLTQDWMREAIFHRSTLCVEALIEAGEIKKRRNEHGMWLMCAAQKGAGDILRKLIDAGVDPNARFIQKDVGSLGDFTSCALHWASSGRAVEELLAAGADIDARNQHGYPPLHTILERVDSLSASGIDVEKRKGFIQAACLLIERGAALELPQDEKGHDWDVFGRMNRMRNDCGEIVHALIKREDFHPVQWAGRVRSLALLESLIDNVPEVDVGLWAKKGVWEGVWIGNEKARSQVLKLINSGVEPPKIEDVIEDMDAWLRLGIPVTQSDIEQAMERFYNKYDPEEDHVEWVEPDPELVSKSNAIALARVAQGKIEARQCQGQEQAEKIAARKPKI